MIYMYANRHQNRYESTLDRHQKYNLVSLDNKSEMEPQCLHNTCITLQSDSAVPALPHRLVHSNVVCLISNIVKLSLLYMHNIASLPRCATTQLSSVYMSVIFETQQSNLSRQCLCNHSFKSGILSSAKSAILSLPSSSATITINLQIAQNFNLSTRRFARSRHTYTPMVVLYP